MANRTNSSEYFWSYEYYWDYIDPIPVDGSKLKVNKYSIVIAFWVGLAAFVTLLFLILLCMSRSGSTPVNGLGSSQLSSPPNPGRTGEAEMPSELREAQSWSAESG
ncbi:melanocortin-2 receptor accessory protein isoform X1 [Neopelma chrysocephalum]|uniref:melanocortin-2 receptor accessory protein isoform X1 n=1 Tax=Neopelma chrysocephalum TaxID=114329 RepID=UPI000FCD4B35|nr:melanocortin-2 receptor accessory protein isoform X1 [Neopelma chrysocephalum]